MGGQDPGGHAERRRQGEGMQRMGLDGPFLMEIVPNISKRRVWGADLQLLFFLVQMQEGKIMERRKKIALELSELVVYCRPVPFDEDSKSCRSGIRG